MKNRASKESFTALLVHLFTATGAVFAMLAMLAAADEKWSLMFLWLVVAFAVDGSLTIEAYEIGVTRR